MGDFHDALHEVEPSAIREVFAEVANVAWNDVGGMEEAKTALREAVEWPLLHSAVPTRVGAPPAKGVLLYGPPGSGKTLLAKAAAPGRRELRLDQRTGIAVEVGGGVENADP